MAWRRAIGAVKDHTSIGLAKVNNSSNSLSDLDVAIVKATRHEEYPSEEKYIREILSLTSYSRHYISACVNTICRRLNKTKNWVVALKTLMLIQRLLQEGDPAYEQEIFFATRRGTRLLNLSDFRDTSRSNSWDYSAFVRIYSLYLDERLEYKMQGRRRKHNVYVYSYEEEDEYESTAPVMRGPRSTPPMRGMSIDQILSKMQRLMQLLERFLATRPTGTAKHNRIIIVALHTIVKESFQIYYETTDILSYLIDKFMELEIPECVKVHEIFSRVSKQFDELDAFYHWCKDVGIGRTSEYPEVERITTKKLELMDEFIRDKAANAHTKHIAAAATDADNDNNDEDEKETAKNDVVEEDLNQIKALPAPESVAAETEDEKKEEETPKVKQKEVDLLDLGNDAVSSEDQANSLALALFDGGIGTPTPPPPPAWEAFSDTVDWETALVQTSSYLPHQKAALGGGLDMMLLEGLYQQGAVTAVAAANTGFTGSASSVAFGSAGNPAPPTQMLALPSPPSREGEGAVLVRSDPFAASSAVAPPAYVQMTELEKKQRLLVEEQMMWDQYARAGMQGSIGPPLYQAQAHQSMGGYGYDGYGYGHGYGR